MSRLRRSAESVVRGMLAVCLPAVLFVGTLPSEAAAQAVAGTLLGTVRDESAAAVPGATVTAIEVNTNISRTAVTNESGYYIFSNLKDGTYRVEAELRASRSSCAKACEVDVNTTVRVDVALAVGDMSETVTVPAETPALQTDRADTGRIIESKQVTEMPLGFNRNFQGILVTVPGTTRPHRAALAVLQLAGQPGDRGQRPVAPGEQHADRGPRQQPQDGPAHVVIPSADAIETVSVSTSNYDAEFGRAGGAVTNVMLRSGTNNFKGSVFYFGNTEATNASDYFTHLKAPTKFSQGGFTLGGPIIEQQALLLRRLPAHHRQPRLRRPRHRADDEDAQRRLQRGRATTIYDPPTGSRQRHRPHAVSRATRFPPNRISPVARRHPGADPRSRTSPARRSARTTTSRRRRARRRPTRSTPS